MLRRDSRIARLLGLAALLAAGLACCRSVAEPDRQAGGPSSAPAVARTEDRYGAAREAMVRTQIEARDVRDPEVLAAMRRVPRHLFVPPEWADSAYGDRPLPIGHEQTISQPYIVALMTEEARVRRGRKVLEIGTGSGYQAAVLAEMGCDVYTIEIVEPLGRQAAALLRRLGYDRVHARVGDGYRGWPEHAPFDAVIVTAAPPQIPEPLKAQTKLGGRLVVPVGVSAQELVVMTRTDSGFATESVLPVRFVPMTGEAQSPHD